VKFIVYGSVSVPAYYEECLALREKLELTDTIEFAGHTSDMMAAYHSGDVIALTSISEAFPYSVVEAMMTGKPCISTDVGGIREALGENGILVNPRDYDALADGIVQLLSQPELRAELGQEGRERALSYFTLERVLEMHLKSYLKLALGSSEQPVRPAMSEADQLAARRRKRRVLTERAYAFMDNEMYLDAVRHFHLAAMEEPDSPAALVLLLEIAEAYNRLGQFDRAFATLEKQQALALVIDPKSA
jgi:tetratricopeptide (TPR) repeat protein